MSKIAVIGLVGNSVFLQVPHFHNGGETIHADGCHMEWGGKGFNQAVAAARQGAEVSFLGACAECDMTAICEVAAQEGMSVTLCCGDDPGKLTSYAAILTDPSGENRVTVYRGQELRLCDVEKFAPCISAADILLLNNEVPVEVNVQAAEIAKSHGVKIIYNPAPARNLPDRLKRVVDVFTPNEFEAKDLGIVDAEVVVTLGGQGCRIRSTDEVIPAMPDVAPVDTTGAGDVFNGVLAVRLAEGASLPEACAAANAAAGKSVAVRYVLPSIPYKG